MFSFFVQIQIFTVLLKVIIDLFKSPGVNYDMLCETNFLLEEKTVTRLFHFISDSQLKNAIQQLYASLTKSRIPMERKKTIK